MKKRIVQVVCLAVAAVLLLAACGKQPTAPDSQTPPAANGAGITVTDLAGQQHTFAQPLQRVVVQWSCAGGPFMTMSALLGEDVPQYLAGIDNSPMKYRQDIWQHYTDCLPALQEIPVIGSVDEELSLEAVLASGAEAMLLPLELKPIADQGVAAKLESAGIPLVYVDFHQESMDNHTASTLLLGKLFGREARAQEIVDFYVTHRQAVTARVEKLLETQARPRVYIEVGMGGPENMGNSFDNAYSWGGIAYHSGAESIGAGVVAGYGPLESEYVLSQDPEKIVLTGANGNAIPDALSLGMGVTEEEARARMDGFFTRPGWSELQAYRNGEVYAIHHGMAREMYDCACFEFFAKICFPEEMQDLDPNETLKTYYETFLPYSYEGLWFVYPDAA